MTASLRALLRPYAGPSGNSPAPPEERLARQIDYPGNDTDCWPWMGSRLPGGYGHIKIDGRTRMAHRVVYEMEVGPIPEGLTLDHLCHNADATCVAGDECLHRRCVNPAHVEPTTMKENTLRGRTVIARNVAATHCIHGHEFTPENTYVPPLNPNFRFCRKCRHDRTRRYRAAATMIQLS